MKGCVNAASFEPQLNLWVLHTRLYPAEIANFSAAHTIKGWFCIGIIRQIV